MEVSWPQEKPQLVLKPSAGWQAINLKQIWQYRDLLMTLAMRDVKLRYRQTALGAIWVILQPLLGAGILSFVFNRVANIPTGSIPPFLFSFAGMLGFTVFSSTLSKSSASLVGNSQLVSKVFFPRLVLPLSTVLSTLVDFGVSLVMLFVLMLIYHITPGVQILLAPLWLALMLLMSLGCGLIAAAVMVSYRDVQYVLPVVLMVTSVLAGMVISGGSNARSTSEISKLVFSSPPPDPSPPPDGSGLSELPVVWGWV